MLPFSAFGWNIQGAVVGPLMVFMLSMGLVMLVHTIKRVPTHLTIGAPSLLLLIFVAFLASTNIFRHDVSTYLLPLLLFLALGLTALESPKLWPSPAKSLHVIKLSFWLLFIFCLIEVFLSNLWKDIWVSIESISLLSGGSNHYSGYRRIRAFTSEPSHLAKILVLYHFLFRFYVPRISKKTFTTEVNCNFILVALSLSNTGFLGIILLEIAAFIFNTRLNWRGKIRPPSLRHIQACLIFLIFVLACFYFDSLFMKLIERFLHVFTSLMNDNVSGSVGFRATALIMPYIYLSGTEGLEFWIGEGFSNFGMWLINSYGHIEGSGFSQGQPGNIFSAITLSGGALGTIIYLTFLIYLFRRLDFFSFLALVFVLFLNVTSGNLTSPLYWGLLSIVYGTSRIRCRGTP